MATARLFTPAFSLLAMVDLTYFTAAGMVLFTTPFFVTGPLGSTPATVGLVIGSFSISTLVMRPTVGRLVDRLGRRLPLLAGAAAAMLVILLHGLVENVPALIVLRVLLGAAEALVFVAGFALLVDLAPPGRMGEALSFNSLALYLGIALGPTVAQALLMAGGYLWVWLGAASLMGAAVLVTLALPETCDASDPAEPSPLVHRAALGPGIALFFGVAATGVLLAYAALHALSIGMRSGSSVLLAYGGTVVVSRILLARVPDRVPSRPLIAGSLGLVATGCLGLGLAGHPAPYLAAAAIVGLGTAFLTPAVFVAVFSVVPAAQRGAASGTLSVFIDLGLGLGPLMAGFVVAAVPVPGAFLAGAAANAAVGGLVLLTMLQMRRGQAAG